MYPSAKFTDLAKEMLKKGWEVFILGAVGEVPKTPPIPGLFNLTAENLNTSFRRSCAVIATADAFVGNDSALLHVAGALEVPAVGLYGPFPWELRTKYAPKTFSLSGKGPCAPCFHHKNAMIGNEFPDNCPSADRGICQVLESIDVSRIIGKIEAIAKGGEPVLVE
jgi:ADP-heptose:LPS heptosyltransferase